MRLLILVALGFAFVAAIPQNEERSRVRGIRRFSLATPGLQAGRVSENEVANDLGEERPVAAEGSEPRPRSRGTSLLRRGHPSRRLIGKQNQENQEPTATITEAVENTPVKSAGNGRDGLRIRRPLKKPTAIVIATTSQPAVEDIAEESLPQTAASTTSASTTLSSEAGTDMHKVEEGMLTEESKPVMKDEFMQEPSDMKDTALTKEQGSEMAEGSNVEDSVSHKSELKSQALPRPKKLRPIPIKLGRRGQGEADQPAAVEAATPDNQEQSQSSGNQASSHRFATRSRPALQARRRPNNKQANQQTEVQQPAVEETATPTEDVSAKTRTRSRVPVIGRQPVRGPSRRRIAQQPESVAEDTPLPIEDSANPSQEPEIRLLNPDEIKALLSQAEVTTPSQKQIRVRPRIKKPQHTNAHEVHDIRPETDSSQPDVEAPISEAVRKGRPQRISPESRQHIPEPHTQNQVTSHKLPTPHYGGSDLVYRGGEVHVTQIGTIEDTPTEQVRQILSGLGSKRRGLSRPKEPKKTLIETPTPVEPAEASTNQELQSNIDFLYDYFE